MTPDPIDLGAAVQALDGLARSHGIRARWTSWTGGHQCGAYVMTGAGWRGESGPWRETASEAFEDALVIAERLRIAVDAEREAKSCATAPEGK